MVNGIVKLFEKTGLFHGYSFNSWSDMVVYDEQFLLDWFNSPQTSLYYSLPVRPDIQDKSDAFVALDDDFKDLFKLDYGTTSTSTCDDNVCVACAE